jgi:hypothetical protein
MKHRVTGIRVRLEVGVALLATCLAIVTLFWRDWIEVFGFDPDNHSGSFEWAIVIGLFVFAGVLWAAAAIEWRWGRRIQPEAAQ